MFLVTSPIDSPHVLDEQSLRKHLSNNGFSDFFIDRAVKESLATGSFRSYDGYFIEKMPYETGTMVNNLTILTYEYINDNVYAKTMNQFSNIEYIKLSDLPKKHGPCKHNNKYLNKFQTFQFWICVDCKEEVSGV